MIVSKEFISLHGVGSYDKCQKLLKSMHSELRRLTDEKLIIGSAIQLFASVEEIEDEALDPKPLIKAVNGILPFIWVNITYDSERGIEDKLLEFQKQFECVQTGSIGEDFYS